MTVPLLPLNSPAVILTGSPALTACAAAAFDTSFFAATFGAAFGASAGFGFAAFGAGAGFATFGSASRTRVTRRVRLHWLARRRG